MPCFLQKYQQKWNILTKINAIFNSKCSIQFLFSGIVMQYCAGSTRLYGYCVVFYCANQADSVGKHKK